MGLTRRQLLVGGVAASVAGLYRCDRFRPAAVGGPYDVAVIGSGFAGTHLGLRTAKAGLATVIVEAAPEKGMDFVSTGVGNPFEFSSVGEIDYDLNASRVIGLGGTSRHWTGRIARLRPSDFRLSSEFGLDVDWPIAYEDLEPYYCEAERLLEASGRAVAEGAEPPRSCPYPRESSRPYRPPEMVVDGRALPFFDVAKSVRPGTDGPVRLAEQEIPEFIGLPEATVVSGFQAIEIVTRDGKTVEHVVVRTKEGKTHRLRARCFVVAAGVMETARLLLQSRSRWFPDGLGNNGDLVGRFFVEHPKMLVRFRPRGPRGISTGVHRTHYFNDRFRSDQLNACHLQLDRLPRGRLYWSLQPEVQPRPENRVALSSSKRDRYDTPTTEVSFGYSERDRRSIERGKEVFFEQARVLGADLSKLEIETEFRDHPAGTCRMGFEPSDGVVDRDNRVFGMENLFISGATTFPTSGTANPTATVVAMTLRLAEHLVRRLA